MTPFFPTERTDGSQPLMLYVGDVLVETACGHYYGDGVLTPATLARLAFPRTARLRQCVCRRWYIAHWQARWCSDQCRLPHRAAMTRRENARRAELRAEWRARSNSWCRHCRGPLHAARASRLFCSAKCRQAAYRSRKRKP
jgi:hypothetical protein